MKRALLWFGFRRIADRLRPLPVTSLRRNRHGRPLPDHRRRNGPRDAGPESGEVGNLLGPSAGCRSSRAKRSAPDGARSISRRCGSVRMPTSKSRQVRPHTRSCRFRPGRRNSGRAVAGRPLRHRASIPLRRRSGRRHLRPRLAGEAIRRLAKRIVDKKLYEKEHWQRMIDEELDRRLGARPDRFVIDGVAYTPFSYADSIGFRRGRLRRVDLLQPTTLFRTVRAGNSRQLGGARDT